jgi:D-alanyl-D-alanine dipeptidase
MVLLSDPAVVDIPTVECGEPLVDLHMVDALRLDSRLADAGSAFAWLRLGVVDRLVTAQTLLAPGLRLLIVEGYRPVTVQAQYFRWYVLRLRAESPGASASQLHRLASRYVAPPEIAPHVTGAAVDLTLCTVDGAELWMGTEVNDTETTACHTDSADISPRARANRHMLSAALRAAGLVNYPGEWWHWSYGDRYWAHESGEQCACYGPVNL